MLFLHITENSFFEGARLELFLNYDLDLFRSKGVTKGPFYLVGPSWSPFYKEGLALRQVAELCDFKLEEVVLNRLRGITSYKYWPNQWTAAEKRELARRKEAKWARLRSAATSSGGK